MLPLSGKNETALHELAERYGNWLKGHPQADLADICYTAGVGRNHFERRAAIVVQSRDQLPRSLAALGQSQPDEALFVSAAERSSGRPKIAWLFTGQGSQYPGMARSLYESQPIFRAVLDECAAVWAETA